MSETETTPCAEPCQILQALRHVYAEQQRNRETLEAILDALRSMPDATADIRELVEAVRDLPAH